MKILVLLSGGLDSALILASLKKDGHECVAIGFDYGQPHKLELDYAKHLARAYSVPFFRVKIEPPIPLIDDVVFGARNLVLAAHAIAHAQAAKFDGIAVGCNSTDWDRFPDCRPAFWKAVEAAAEAYNIRVFTPLLHHWKAEIVRQAKELGMIVEATWSCYAPTADDQPCGQCLACTVRREAMK